MTDRVPRVPTASQPRPGRGGKPTQSEPRPRVPVPLRDAGRGTRLPEPFTTVGPRPSSQAATQVPLWQVRRAEAATQAKREQIDETACRRCHATVWQADANGVMPVTLDPAELDHLGYVVAELSGRAVWGVRETTPGRRVVDDYWPAHPGDPPAHVDVTWYATHRCPTPTDHTATDGTSTTEGNR